MLMNIGMIMALKYIIYGHFLHKQGSISTSADLNRLLLSLRWMTMLILVPRYKIHTKMTLIIYHQMIDNLLNISSKKQVNYLEYSPLFSIFVLDACRICAE